MSSKKLTRKYLVYDGSRGGCVTSPKGYVVDHIGHCIKCNNKDCDIDNPNNHDMSVCDCSICRDCWYYEVDKNYNYCPYCGYAISDFLEYIERTYDGEESEEESEEESDEESYEENVKRKPVSAYSHFFMNTRDIIRKENPSFSAKERMAELGRRWKSLTADEKAPFLKLEAEDTARTKTKKPAANPKKEENYTTHEDITFEYDNEDKVTVKKVKYVEEEENDITFEYDKEDKVTVKKGENTEEVKIVRANNVINL